MKISLEWLAEYLPGALEARAAGEALTNGGLVVEVFEKHGDDEVIDVEVTSNRGDCLSHVGIARELSALLKREFKGVEAKAAESATAADSVTSVAIEAEGLCPHYTARVIRGVKVGPSPEWMQKRLAAVGLPVINNIVDVTNYVMFEMGQPLHTFDFDKLAGGRIVVREAKAGEKIVSIDGKARELAGGMLVIADAQRPVAIAGVMGGKETEISGGTVNVLLESARFDALSVRKTARALAMRSDSSYRFERQIDPTLPERASLRAAQLIMETAGGELLSGVVSAGAPGYAPRPLSLRLERLRAVLGVNIAVDAAVGALARLGLLPVLQGDRIDCTVPSWRLDLNIEVDLVEEVARVVGYEKIPVRDEVSIRLTPPERERSVLNKVRDVLVGAGYYESITVSFVSDVLAGDFVPPEATTLLRADAAIRADNARLRPSLVPGLLEVARRNESVGTQGAKFFEEGSVFWTDAGGGVVERRRVGLVGSADVREVRGTVEAVLWKLNRERVVSVVPDKRPGYANGACGRIEWGGQVVGYLGRVERKAAEKLSLRELPAAAELEVPVLQAGAMEVPQLRALPRLPAVRRDLSLVVKETTPYQDIDGVLRGLALADLEDVEYVTTYRGRPLEKDVKSVTVTLVFRSTSATLTSEQVEGSVQRAVGAAKEKLGAVLRT